MSDREISSRDMISYCLSLLHVPWGECLCTQMERMWCVEGKDNTGRKERQWMRKETHTLKIFSQVRVLNFSRLPSPQPVINLSLEVNSTLFIPSCCLMTQNTIMSDICNGLLLSYQLPPVNLKNPLFFFVFFHKRHQLCFFHRCHTTSLSFCRPFAWRAVCCNHVPHHEFLM